MSLPIARLGDLGSHGGTIITAATQSKCEGRFIARVGDIYSCPIHGQNPIVTGSMHWLTEGQLTARGDGVQGSMAACGAIMIGGSAESVTEGNNIQSAPASGSADLSTTTPIIIWTNYVTMTPGAAALVLDSTPPITGPSAMPAAAALALNPSSPISSANFALSPIGGFLTLTPTLPTFANSGVPVPPSASLVLAGAQPLIAISLSPDSAVLAASGTLPVSRQNSPGMPIAAALALASSPPTVAVSSNLTPAAASLSITATIPTSFAASSVWGRLVWGTGVWAS